jgi:hypothetical protein
VYTFAVEEADVTSAWAAACKALDRKANPERTAFHTLVRISTPTIDDSAFRAELEQVRFAAVPAGDKDSFVPIETVANTIFPQALATSSGRHDRLVARYRDLYGRAKRFPGNQHDTYFGRLVAYPSPKGAEPVDQIGWIINRLKQQMQLPGPMTAAYEADVAHPTLDGSTGTEPAAVDGHIHVGGKDTLIRGFPCLSNCSFQLEHGQVLHLAAYYRYHYMLERAYGNYLGLGRLLAYVADQAGVRPGTLTVMAGYAQLEGPITKVRPLLWGEAPMIAL